MISIYHVGFRWVEDFLIYFDPNKEAYYSINLVTGRRILISSGINKKLKRETMTETPGRPYNQGCVGIGGWLANDQGVLIYDNYDVWKVHLSDGLGATCITNGMGAKTSTKFRIISGASQVVFDSRDELILLLLIW